MDVKDVMHVLSAFKATPSSHHFALGASTDLSSLLSEDDHGTEPVTWPQRAAAQREQTQFLRTSDWLLKSAFYFSALQKYFFLPRKEIFTSHIPRVKTRKVKISRNICRNTVNNDNTNPKANKASLRS